MVMTLFALLLAFVIVNLYNGYESASDNVSASANSLSKVVTDVHVFPRVEEQRIDAAVAKYVKELRTREFALLRDGRSDPRAQGYLNAMIETLERYSPAAEAQTAFYSVTADDLAALATQRNDRIDAAEASIPAPLWGLLILLAVLTLVTSIMLGTHYFGLDLVLCLSIAAVVGAGMVTASILEYPFSGSIAVSSAPFDRADLNRIVQSHP